MVEMGMCQHYADRMQFVLLNVAEQLVPLLAVVESRVYDCTFPLVVPDKAAPLLKCIEYKKMSMYHQNQILFTKIRKELLNLSPI